MDFRIIIDSTFFSGIILPPENLWYLRIRTESCQRKFMQSSSQCYLLGDWHLPRVCITLQKGTSKSLPNLDKFSRSSQRTCFLIQKHSHKCFVMVAHTLSHLRERLRGDKDYQLVRAPENSSGQHDMTISTTSRTSMGRSLRVTIHILVAWSKSIFKTSWINYK